MTYLEIASETSDFIGKIVILFTYFNIKTNISFNDLKNILKVFNFKIAYMIGVFNFKNVRTKNFFYNLPYFSNKDEKYSILLSKFTKKTQSRMYIVLGTMDKALIFLRRQCSECPNFVV